jgi:Domain of unknown function (DUF4386)
MKRSIVPVRTTGLSVGRAALIAGLVVFVPTAPFAEYVFARVIHPSDAAGTIRNIVEQEGLFIAGILAQVVTFALDVVLAWALYIFLKPVNDAVSRLAAWFRLAYAAIALVALANLVTALRLATTPAYLEAFGPGPLAAQVLLAASAFRDVSSIAFMIFGLYLGLLGALVLASTYVPRFLGVLLIAAGLRIPHDDPPPVPLPESRRRLRRHPVFRRAGLHALAPHLGVTDHGSARLQRSARDRESAMSRRRDVPGSCAGPATTGLAGPASRFSPGG